MNKENIYTSTGSKLIYHPGVVDMLKTTGMATPMSLQVAPTSRCNLNCCFCSNRNREKHEDIDLALLTNTIKTLCNYGLKTVEWTGGGDPTMYGDINRIMSVCNEWGLEQGMITNGIPLKENISPAMRDALKWVRISMNGLDYHKDIDLPDIKGTLGFSYCINKMTDLNTWRWLQEYVDKYKPAYVRIVPDCQATDEEQNKNNAQFSRDIAQLGEPYFYQAKVFKKPDRCWWGYFKPFLLHDEYVYPCSSVVLNEDSEETFHVKYRWVHVSELEKKYEERIASIPNATCNHCVFNKQNTEVDSIINPSGMENFI